MASDLEKLDRLARKNGRYSLYSLVGLFVVFFFAIYMFLVAGDLARKDTSASGKAAEYSLEKELERISKNRAEVDGYIAEYTKELKVVEDSGRQRVDERISRAKYDLELLDKKYKQRSEEFDALRSARLAELSAAKESNIEEVVSVAITRLGAVMLSVFMMQILLSFYRYFLRLSNYYETKIAAIEGITDTNITQEILRGISPEQISFGKEPQMPFDKIVEVIKLTK